jgi:hypothetical protein
VSLVALLAVDQRLVTEAVTRLHDETVPWTLERQRLARNLEELRMGGQRVLTASDPPTRSDALFVVRILAAHPGMGEDPRTAELAAEVEGFLVRSAATQGAPDMKAWDVYSRRLRLLADDLSVEGGQRVSAELDRMSEAVEQTRYKLLLNVLLVGVFLASFLFILRRYLIQPLQRITPCWSAWMGASPAAPEFILHGGDPRGGGGHHAISRHPAGERGGSSQTGAPGNHRWPDRPAQSAPLSRAGFG